MDRWKAYHAVEPLTGPNWMLAQVCQTVANAMRAGGKAASLEDFLPRIQAKGQSTADMKTSLLAAIGG